MSSACVWLALALLLATAAPTSIHANAPYTIRGSAYDASASAAQGTGVDRVEVYLNGDRQTGVFVGDATLVPTTVYAHSRVTGQETRTQVSVTVSIP